MSNYIIEDEVEDRKFPTANKPHKNSIDQSKMLMIGSAILVVMIIVIVIASRVKVRTEYSSLEIEMVEKAEEYIKKNDLLSSEVYVDAPKMNITVPSNCNMLSGVLYQDEKYYPHLMCDDYNSKTITENNDIELIGSDIIILLKGTDYYELGHNSNKDIQISGTVHTEKEGIYNVYYIPQDGNYVKIRKVIVVDNIELMNNLPVMNVSKDDLTIEFGQTYNDNVTAIDKNDGNITNKIIKVSNVNENEIGEYKSVYSVTNSLGYTVMSMQKVTVLNTKETNILVELSDDNITNETVTINVKVVGDNFDYVILPDKTEKNEKEFIYEVEENDDYEFIAVNKDGSKVSKIVKVTNIDKTTPEGNCQAILYNDKTIFNVKISTFNYVVGYNYYYNGKESGFISKSSYTVNESKKNDSDLYVVVKDYIGNENKISCSTSAKQYNNNPNGYQLTFGGKPRLRIPITEALAKKGYTVNDLNMCIAKRVESAGPGTRYGVVEAAYGLIDCTYKMTGMVLSYDHSGGKVEEENTKTGGKTKYCTGINKDICGKLGINTSWGKPGGSENTSYGLNCATFVRWAMCNGGMDLCSRGSAGAFGMVSKTYFPEADGVYIWGTQVTYYSGKDMTSYNPEQLIRMIKPGDVMAHKRPNDDANGQSQHAYVVIGKDNEGIYTANDGYYITKIRYSKMLNGEYSYLILYLDRYYDNVANRNNLYN